MIREYIQIHQDQFLSKLFDLLRIPSVSADSKHKQDVRKAAEFVVQKLKDAGADKVELCETNRAVQILIGYKFRKRISLK